MKKFYTWLMLNWLALFMVGISFAQGYEPLWDSDILVQRATKRVKVVVLLGNVGYQGGYWLQLHPADSYGLTILNVNHKVLEQLEGNYVEVIGRIDPSHKIVANKFGYIFVEKINDKQYFGKEKPYFKYDE
jgi:hypothetical protein